MRMTIHELVLKDFTSYPVPETTNENHKHISVRISSVWAKFLNLRPQVHEGELLTT
jgi:hypothetical protein